MKRFRTIFTCTVAGLLVLAAGGWANGNNRLLNPGFEDPTLAGWLPPWGGGLHGGQGGGLLARSATGARSGTGSAVLMSWNEQKTGTFGWACLAQLVPCGGFSRVESSAWLTFQSTNMPVHPQTTSAQLLIEYYADDEGQVPINTYASMSTPLQAQSHAAAGTWTPLELKSRIPDQARTLRFSILLMAEKTDAEPQAVWIDDAALILSVGKSDSRLETRYSSKREGGSQGAGGSE